MSAVGAGAQCTTTASGLDSNLAPAGNSNSDARIDYFKDHLLAFTITAHLYCYRSFFRKFYSIIHEVYEHLL